MSKTMKHVAIGIAIIIIGVAVLVVGLGLNGWQYAYADDYEMHTETVEGYFGALEIDVGVGDIEVRYDSVTELTVEYPTSEHIDAELKLYENDKVTFTSKLNWFVQWDFFRWNFSSIPKTVIKIPRYSNVILKMKLSAGKATVMEGYYKNIDVDMSAGSVKFDGEIICDNFNVSLSAGKLDITEVFCKSFKADVSAGAINVNSLSCSNIDFDVSAGSVNATVWGHKSNYNIEVEKSAGSCNLSPQTVTDDIVFDHLIRVKVSAGSVNVNFKN